MLQDCYKTVLIKIVKIIQVQFNVEASHSIIKIMVSVEDLSTTKNKHFIKFF